MILTRLQTRIVREREVIVGSCMAANGSGLQSVELGSRAAVRRGDMIWHNARIGDE